MSEIPKHCDRCKWKGTHPNLNKGEPFCAYMLDGLDLDTEHGIETAECEDNFEFLEDCQVFASAAYE